MIAPILLLLVLGGMVVAGLVTLVWLCVQVSQLRRRVDHLERATHPEPAPEPQDLPTADAAPAWRDEPPVPAPAGAPTFENAGAETFSSSLAPDDGPPVLPAEAPSIPFAPPPGQTAAGRPWGSVDWEQFMGARLFAWLGGLALFLGVAYFVKYSFERDLIPPAGRVLIGLATGLGLVGGGLRLWRTAYGVTAQTLCATGVVILYAALFAGHAFYRLPWLPQSLTFAAMTLITAGAFLLAARLQAQVVAVLGLLGGFLTPILLSSGQDQALALFTYIALLNAGLMAVALRRRWEYLVLLGAIGTWLLQWGWAGRFLTPDRLWTGWAVFAGFNALFALGLGLAKRCDRASDWWSGALTVTAVSTLGWVGGMLLGTDAGTRPAPLFAMVLAADVVLLAAAWWRARWTSAHVVAGMIAFGYVALWQARFLTPELLGWALGLSLGFAVLHVGFPLLLVRWQSDRGTQVVRSAQLFPPLALLMLALPLLRLAEASFALWPVLLLVNLLALALAVWARGLFGAGAAAMLTLLTTGLWIGRIASVPTPPLGFTLLMVVGAAVLFGAAAWFLWERARRTSEPDDAQSAMLRQFPVITTLMPFLLLAQVVVVLPIPDPTPVFAAALALVGVLLVLALRLRIEFLPLAGLGGLALLQHVWWLDELSGATHPGRALVGCLVFLACFGGLPWWARRTMETLRWPWVAVALAGLPQFHLVYRLIERYWPNEIMGLIPLAFAVPPALALAGLVRSRNQQSPWHLERLAWMGGATLAFVTLAFPIQFERQWLTLGLALEGAALLWLFRKVPHPGLRLVGVVMLSVVFLRLCINPAVLEYAVRGPHGLWNVWLYTYSLAAAAMFLGARALQPPDDCLGPLPGRAWLAGLGTVLVFALVNLQIADYFTPVGEWVRFDFSGNFARDMTYTIAWALFALALVGIGIGKRLVVARWAGLALLGVAVAKLFLHDLARLDQLYRVGALIAVALVAITASVLYQRFIARELSRPAP
ncbi:MAG: DUF2339 domain-containing protein [Verrucomicrobiae bacterium]|nr:DUF2339 domain-containing protein [Verrucomicrobiae bacterium]